MDFSHVSFAGQKPPIQTERTAWLSNSQVTVQPFSRRSQAGGDGVPKHMRVVAAHARHGAVIELNDHPGTVELLS